MTTVTLIAFRDEPTGELGLGLKGLARDESTNAAIDGALIAHDLIEHVNGVREIGTIDDELEALGAIWYVRGQWGELRRDGVGSLYTIEENIASDVTRMFRDHVEGQQYVSYSLLRTRPCEADVALEDILHAADMSYADEFDDDSKQNARVAWPAYRAVCLHRMRIGYRKARRKWERHGRFAANNRFWSIANAVDACLRRGELCEGQEYKLTYSATGARCEADYGEDY